MLATKNDGFPRRGLCVLLLNFFVPSFLFLLLNPSAHKEVLFLEKVLSEVILSAFAGSLLNSVVNAARMYRLGAIHGAPMGVVDFVTWLLHVFISRSFDAHERLLGDASIPDYLDSDGFDLGWSSTTY